MGRVEVDVERRERGVVDAVGALAGRRAIRCCEKDHRESALAADFGRADALRRQQVHLGKENRDAAVFAVDGEKLAADRRPFVGAAMGEGNEQALPPARAAAGRGCGEIERRPGKRSGADAAGAEREQHVTARMAGCDRV